METLTHNVFEPWPLNDKSVQSIITSPPYWSLRKYDIPDVVIGGDEECDHKFDMEKQVKSVGAWFEMKTGFCQCGAWKGQYGLEPLFKNYIEHTRLWAKEAWRVLKDDGVFFLNLGDSYGTGAGGYWSAKPYPGINENMRLKKQPVLGKEKCKLLIPHRVAIALIDDGWILRNDVVWYKPNAMPESCQDRFSKKFEYIFMFVKQKKYYFDLDAIRAAHKYDGREISTVTDQKRIGTPMEREIRERWPGKGANPGDVWTINTTPSPHDHYAMWPEKLVDRMVRCSSKVGDTVLDPFCGSGTTLRVVDGLNRSGVGFDIGYESIQKKRTRNIQRKLI